MEVAEKFKDPEATKDAKTIKDIVRYTPESGQRDILVAAESLIAPLRRPQVCSRHEAPILTVPLP